jgi:hypothetical protein
MTIGEKVLFYGAIAFACLGIFALGHFVHAPSKALGGSVLYVPQYQVTADATTNSSTSVGTLIASVPGVLHTIDVGTAASGSIISIYDDASTTIVIGTTKLIGTITVVGQVPLVQTYDAQYQNGLVVDMTGATSTVTANYQVQ